MSPTEIKPRVRERALNVGCPYCLAQRDEPCRTSEGMREWAHLQRVEAARERVVEAPLPEPMPACLADGTRVWLHYDPIRWEKHP